MIWLDIETRGPLDVTKYGAYAHARHPDIKIISLHWAFDDGPVQRWRGLFSPGPDEMEPEPAELLDRIGSGEEVVVWNAQYERLVFDGPAGEELDLPRLQPGQLICAATWARFHNLPGDLKTCGQAVLPKGHGKLASTKFRALWNSRHPLLLDVDAENWARREAEERVRALAERGRYLRPPDPATQ